MRIPESIVRLIKDLCEQRTFANESLTSESQTYKSLVDNNVLFLSNNTSGGLSQQGKVLMMLGHYAICGTDQEIEWGVSAAIHVGARKEEIRETLDFAILTGGGGAVSRVQLASSILQYRLSEGGKDDRFRFSREGR